MSSHSHSPYWLAGLRIESAIALPILAEWNDRLHTQGAVSISRGSLKGHAIDGAFDFGESSCTPTELFFEVDKIARYLIRNGQEIVVDIEGGADANDVAAYLLGTALGVLCHQRGLVPLHASAIDVDGEGCAAFVGDSGAGKSTVIAALAGQGQQVISDDVCFLEAGNDLRIWPGIGRIRLWEDSLNALELERAGAVREYQGYDKFVMPLEPPPNPDRPRILKRIYQLRASGVAAPAITRVRGAAAIDLIMRNIYRLEYAEHMGLRQAIFARCAPLARQVPVFEFDRPLSFERMPADVAFLLKHITAPL